jgi:hypothetical protein
MKISWQEVMAPADVDTQDGGQAKIWQPQSEGGDGLFVRVQSWSEKCDHRELDQLIGKTVRVTVEIVDPV